LAKQIGKYKVDNATFERFESKLDVNGGTVEGDLSVAGDLDILNTLSASSGHLLVPGDFLFQTDNGGSTTDILSTTGLGSAMSLYNNLVYIDGTNLGIGTVEPSGKLEVVGNVVLSDLPTTEPTTAGGLWISGSTNTGNSGFLAVKKS